MAISCFLSYAEEDRGSAQLFKSGLQSRGVDVVMDEDFPPGVSLPQFIAEQIDSVDVLIVLLSPNSISSQWVLKEVAIAIAGQIGHGRPRVIPVMVEACEVPVMLQDILYLKLSKQANHEGDLDRLAHAVGVETLERPEVATQPTPLLASDIDALERLINEGDGVKLMEWINRYYVRHEAVPRVAVNVRTGEVEVAWTASAFSLRLITEASYGDVEYGFVEFCDGTLRVSPYTTSDFPLSSRSERLIYDAVRLYNPSLLLEEEG